MGTPEFAVESLRLLHEGPHKVVAAVTAVDKEAGRGLKVRMSAVKEYCLAYSIPVLQPEKLKNETFLQILAAYNADLFIVVAFRMLPQVVWAMPKLGTINLHASLLPQYRGAAPIQRCIMNGEKQTGVTTFYIEEKIDAGKILLQEVVAIDEQETGGSLHDKLMGVGARLLAETADRIAAGTIHATDQSQVVQNTELKEAPKLFSDDCKIDWTLPAVQIRNHVRGLNPFPCAWTNMQQGGGDILRVKIYVVNHSLYKENLLPGHIIRTSSNELIVGTGYGCLVLEELHVAGKKRMKTADFLRGFTVSTNDKFR